MAVDDVAMLVALLWGVLGIAAGAHATTHERNGPFWFAVVALTGVFGAAVYGLIVAMGHDEATAVDVDDPVTMAED